MAHAPSHHGLHGPRCRLLSALAGATLGVIIAALAPATFESVAAPGQKHLGTKMPSFFADILYAVAILLPILILNWFVFIR